MIYVLEAVSRHLAGCPKQDRQEYPEPQGTMVEYIYLTGKSAVKQGMLRSMSMLLNIVTVL